VKKTIDIVYAMNLNLNILIVSHFISIVDR